MLTDRQGAHKAQFDDLVKRIEQEVHLHIASPNDNPTSCSQLDVLDVMEALSYVSYLYAQSLAISENKKTTGKHLEITEQRRRRFSHEHTTVQ